MSQETTNPLIDPEKASHEVVLELIKSGNLVNSHRVTEVFTLLLNHYRSELVRIQNENKAQ